MAANQKKGKKKKDSDKLLSHQAQGFWETRPADWGIGQHGPIQNAAVWTTIQPMSNQRRGNRRTALNSMIEGTGRGIQTGWNRARQPGSGGFVVNRPGPAPAVPAAQPALGPGRTPLALPAAGQTTGQARSHGWQNPIYTPQGGGGTRWQPGDPAPTPGGQIIDVSSTIVDKPVYRQGSRAQSRTPKESESVDEELARDVARTPRTKKRAAGVPLQSIGNAWGEEEPERIPGTPLQSIGNPWAYDPRE